MACHNKASLLRLAQSLMHLLVFFVSSLLLLTTTTTTLGQRVNKGCYDAKQLSCDNNNNNSRNNNQPLPTTIQAQDVCRTIIKDIFPLPEVITDLSRHAEILNGISPDSQLCHDVAQVYHLCAFCHADESFFFDCDAAAMEEHCGGKPDRQQVLNSAAYPAFSTDADIESACDELERAYAEVVMTADFSADFAAWVNAGSTSTGPSGQARAT